MRRAVATVPPLAYRFSSSAPPCPATLKRGVQRGGAPLPGVLRSPAGEGRCASSTIRSSFPLPGQEVGQVGSPFGRATRSVACGKLLPSRHPAGGRSIVFITPSGCFHRDPSGIPLEALRPTLSPGGSAEGLRPSAGSLRVSLRDSISPFFFPPLLRKERGSGGVVGTIHVVVVMGAVTCSVLTAIDNTRGRDYYHSLAEAVTSAAARHSLAQERRGLVAWPEADL